MKMIHLTAVLIMLLPIITFCSEDEGNNNNEPYKLSDSPRIPHKSVKRGVAYGCKTNKESEYLFDLMQLSSGVSWFYNWANSVQPASVVVSVHDMGYTYYPMCWNNSYNTKSIESTVATLGSDYLLAYNEPNLIDQAKMTPSQAAEKWSQLVAVAKNNNLKIVSPAMNYGTLAGYSDPEKWLDEFFTLIDPNDIAAISVHCYMPNVTALKSYIDKFAKYGKPIWLTEFCAWDGFNGGEVGQREYMSEAINYLEAHPNVERYAWFTPRYDGGNDPKMQLFQDNSITDRGEVYIGASSQDDEVYCIEEQNIHAARFVRCNASNIISTDSAYVATPHYRPTTDEADDAAPMDIYHFGVRQWVEYQIEVENDGEYDLSLRTNAMVKTRIELSVDDEALAISESTTSNVWETLHTTISLKAGKHTLRLKVKSGNTALNHLKFIAI